MARTSEDALRSVKRAMALVLGEAWEVRLSREEGMFKRPFCRVALAGPENYATGAAHTADIIQAVVIHCYPARVANPDQALIEALRVKGDVSSAIRFGHTAAGIAPMRIPLYDYDGQNWDEAASGRVTPHDYLRVSDLSLEHSLDDTEEYLSFVGVDLRVAWRMAGERPEATLVQALNAEHVPE